MEGKVLKAVSTGVAMKAQEIADAAGITKQEADKAIKKLVAENKMVSPKRCFYQIVK